MSVENPLPEALLLAGSNALNGDGVWAFDGRQQTRNEIAHAVLDAVPPGWIKTDDGWQHITIDGGAEHSEVGLGENASPAAVDPVVGGRFIDDHTRKMLAEIDAVEPMLPEGYTLRASSYPDTILAHESGEWVGISARGLLGCPMWSPWRGSLAVEQGHSYPSLSDCLRHGLGVPLGPESPAR